MERFYALTLGILLLVPITGYAENANDKLMQGIAAYEELEWATAISRLNEALERGLPKSSQIQAHRYLGFSYIDTNLPAEAKRAFENLLNLDADYALDPNLPPKYRQVFDQVKSGMKSVQIESSLTQQVQPAPPKKEDKPKKGGGGRGIFYAVGGVIVAAAVVVAALVLGGGDDDDDDDDDDEDF